MPAFVGGDTILFLGLRPAGFMRGRLSLHPPMQALRPAPREVVRGWEPLRPPMRGGAAPLQEQVVRLGSSLLPMGGPTRPTPGVPFVSRRKEPKACRGCAPGPPLGGIIIPPAARACMRLLLPPERVCATNPDRFATLRWVGESVFFSPSVSARAHLLVSGRGAAGGRTNGSCCFCAG